MHGKLSKTISLFLALLCVLLLSGCREGGLLVKAATQPEVSQPPVYQGEAEMDLSEMSASELLEQLPTLTALQRATLKADSLSCEELRKLQTLRPDVQFSYSFTLDGTRVSLEETTLNLSAAGNAALRTGLEWAEVLPALESIELGKGEADDGRIPWDALARLRTARPDVKVNYSFTLFGQPFTLESEEMNFSHIPMDDQGALVRAVTACMPALRYLDMDTCNVDDEHMAAIRDALPQAEVVWRIWFGEKNYMYAGYSVRTNVDRILASNPGIGGELTPENTQSLKYCTKVKYLDLGHNSYMRSIDFVRYMPDLEAVVLAMGNWFDASPLENCAKLRYAELQTTAISDLRPLTKLKNLEDLNLCYCLALHDISPLYEMTQLKRLYIGMLTPVPPEQVERMHEFVPACEINTEVQDPTDGQWRLGPYNEFGYRDYTPSYTWLRQVMKYDDAPESYAYTYNDPLY